VVVSGLMSGGDDTEHGRQSHYAGGIQEACPCFTHCSWQGLRTPPYFSLLSHHVKVADRGGEVSVVVDESSVVFSRLFV